ncbi:prepilin-type N-terminal cleavage/methylation domain-containing protein [Phormidium nigroviride]
MKSLVLLKNWQRSFGQAIANLDRKNSKSFGNTKQRQQNSGFTLLEMLILLLIIGILSSIAAPGWLAFINNQRLRTSQSRVYGALQLAQSNAKRDKVAWQASFRTQGTVVQWAIHPATTDPTTLPVSISPSSAPNVWYSLEDKIAIDSETSSTTKTTLQEIVAGTSYKAIFNRQGCLVNDAANECTDTVTVPQRITLQHADLGSARKCAVVETLLGAMRTGDDKDNCD